MGNSEQDLFRSIALDLEQYLINTLRAQELSQKTGEIDPRIAGFSERALGIIDTYILHKSYMHGQLQIVDEPIVLANLLSEACDELAKIPEVTRPRLLFENPYPLISADLKVIKEIVKCLALFIGSFDSDGAKNSVTINAYNKSGTRVGVFSKVSLSRDNFKVLEGIKSRAIMPLPVQSSSAGSEYYLAKLLAEVANTKIELTKRRGLYGFSFSLQENTQLKLI